MARTRTPEPTPGTVAEEQAAQDAALLAALQERDGDTPPDLTQPRTPRRATIGENYISAVELIKEARTRTRLSEATLVKVYELNLMWALNNRGSVNPELFDDTEMVGDEGQGAEAPDLPEPHEVITGDDEESTDGS